MHQIKMFVDLESNLSSLEERINRWLRESKAEVVDVFGNIAAQTGTAESKGGSLGERKFSSSDVLITVVYEAA